MLPKSTIYQISLHFQSTSSHGKPVIVLYENVCIDPARIDLCFLAASRDSYGWSIFSFPAKIAQQQYQSLCTTQRLDGAYITLCIMQIMILNADYILVFYNWKWSFYYSPGLLLSDDVRWHDLICSHFDNCIFATGIWMCRSIYSKRYLIQISLFCYVVKRCLVATSPFWRKYYKKTRLEIRWKCPYILYVKMFFCATLLKMALIVCVLGCLIQLRWRNGRSLSAMCWTVKVSVTLVSLIKDWIWIRTSQMRLLIQS